MFLKITKNVDMRDTDLKNLDEIFIPVGPKRPPLCEIG